MTYNVFGGKLNLTQSINQSHVNQPVNQSLAYVAAATARTTKSVTVTQLGNSKLTVQHLGRIGLLEQITFQLAPRGRQGINHSPPVFQISG